MKDVAQITIDAARNCVVEIENDTRHSVDDMTSVIIAISIDNIRTRAEEDCLVDSTSLIRKSLNYILSKINNSFVFSQIYNKSFNSILAIDNNNLLVTDEDKCISIKL